MSEDELGEALGSLDHTPRKPASPTASPAHHDVAGTKAQASVAPSGNTRQKTKQKVPQATENILQRQAREEIEKNIAYHEQEASRLRQQRREAGLRLDTAARKLGSLDVVGAAQSVRPEDLNPFTHMREVTAPIQQAMGVLGNRLLRHDPLQGHSPLQREVEKQTGKLPLKQQMQAQDPRGLLRNLSPDASRQIDSPSPGIKGFAKGVIGSAADMVSVENAAIAVGLGSHMPVISQAAQGVFGAEAAKGVSAGLDKYKKSGYKDTAALGEAAFSAAIGASIFHHATGPLREQAKANAAAKIVLDHPTVKQGAIDRVTSRYGIDPARLRKAITEEAKRRGISPTLRTPDTKTLKETVKQEVTAKPEAAKPLPVKPEHQAEIDRRAAARRPVVSPQPEKAPEPVTKPVAKAPGSPVQRSKPETRPEVPPAQKTSTEANVEPKPVRLGTSDYEKKSLRKGGKQEKHYIAQHDTMERIANDESLPEEIRKRARELQQDALELSRSFNNQRGLSLQGDNSAASNSALSGHFHDEESSYSKSLNDFDDLVTEHGHTYSRGKVSKVEPTVEPKPKPATKPKEAKPDEQAKPVQQPEAKPAKKAQAEKTAPEAKGEVKPQTYVTDEQRAEHAANIDASLKAHEERMAAIESMDEPPALNHEAAVRAAHTKLESLKSPHAGIAHNELSKLEALGIDTSDAREALEEYKSIARSDFDSTEDYKEARSEAWGNFIQEHGMIDASEVEQPEPDPAAPEPVKETEPVKPAAPKIIRTVGNKVFYRTGKTTSSTYSTRGAAIEAQKTIEGAGPVVKKGAGEYAFDHPEEASDDKKDFEKQYGNGEKNIEGVTPASPRPEAFRANRIRGSFATGKKAILSRLRFEARKKINGLSPEAAGVAESWIKALDPRYLETLGSSYFKESTDRGTPGTYMALAPRTIGRGQGQRYSSLFEIGKALTNDHIEPNRVIPHEVAHHIESQVDPEHLRALEAEYLRQKRQFGKAVAQAREDIKGLKYRQDLDPSGKPQKMNRNQTQFLSDSYRYENFSEFFAESLADRVIENHFRDNAPAAARNIFSRMIASAKDFIRQTYDHLLGMPDKRPSQRIYDALMRGDYTRNARTGAIRPIERNIEGQSHENDARSDDGGPQSLHAGISPSEIVSGVRQAGGFLSHISHGGRYREAYKYDKEVGDSLNAVVASPSAARVMGKHAEDNIFRGLDAMQKQELGELTVGLRLSNQGGRQGHPQYIDPATVHRYLASDPKLLAAFIQYEDFASRIQDMRLETNPGMNVMGGPGAVHRSLEVKTFENGNPAPPLSGGGPGRSVVNRYSKRGSRFARKAGSGQEEYHTALEGYTTRMMSENLRNVHVKRLYDRLLSATDSAGNPLAVPPGTNGSAPTAMTWEGKPVERIGKVTFEQRVRGKLTHMNLYMPEELAGDVRDAIEPDKPETALAGAAKKVVGVTVGIQLFAPQDGLRHFWRMSSVISHIPDAIDRGSPTANAAHNMRRVTEALLPTHGILPKWTRLYDIFNNDMSLRENQQILEDITSANAGSDRAFSNYIGTLPGISNVQHFVHDSLFSVPEGKGLKGFDLRTRVYAEKMRRAVEPPRADGTHDPKRMREFANQFGQYTSKPDRLIQIARYFNPFSATALPVRVAEMRHLTGDAGFNTSGMTKPQIASLRAETLFRGTIQTAVGIALMNKAMSGHWPWENEKGKANVIDTGKKDKDGAEIYFDLEALPGFGDPSIGRASRQLGVKEFANFAREKDPNALGLDLLMHAGNTLVGDTLRNPLGDTASIAAFGGVPYVSRRKGQALPSFFLPVAKKVPVEKQGPNTAKLPSIIRKQFHSEENVKRRREKQLGEQRGMNIRAAAESINPLIGTGIAPFIGEARGLRPVFDDPFWKYVQFMEAATGPVLKKGSPPEKPKKLPKMP